MEVADLLRDDLIEVHSIFTLFGMDACEDEDIFVVEDEYETSVADLWCEYTLAACEMDGGWEEES